MNYKKMVAAKGSGRKLLFTLDSLLPIIFIVIVLTFSLRYDFMIFAYFSMGLVVTRVGEIIFEMKQDLFEKPFFHFLLLIGIPIQIAWDYFR